MRKSALLLVAACACIAGSSAMAVQFPVLDPGYNQQIYAGPQVDAGMAWTPTNHLLSRNGDTVREYNLTQNSVHQGTNLHGVIATHVVPGLPNSGVGMTNGLDGYIYAITTSGLARFPNNFSGPATLLPGTAGGQYGVTTLPDGRIAYTDSGGTSNVYIYDPVGATNTLIYSASFLVDGMVASPSGHLAITGQTNQTMTILTNTGSVVNFFATPHYPDGLAFSATPSSSTLYSNNNDGTITRYAMGPGFTGVPTVTDIASGAQAYGDLATVGSDCAFYVWSGENGSYHGATPGVGTNWDNLITNAEPSITRIGLNDSSGLGGEVCGFYTPLTGVLPEPGSISLLLLPLAARLLGRRRK